MIKRLASELIIQPKDVRPSDDRLSVAGVANPAVSRFGGTIYLLIRVLEEPKESRPGCFALPRYEFKNGRPELCIDVKPESQIRELDSRSVWDMEEDCLRLRHISHLRLARSADGIRFDDIDERPLVMAANEYEAYGIEDPRITQIDDTFWTTVVGVSKQGICTFLLRTDEFREFHREGIILCPDNKDVLLFPERVDGEYVALHRPQGACRFGEPAIWSARSADLRNWGRHRVTIRTDPRTEEASIGGGAPPIRTDRGWLEIFHSTSRTGMYYASAALLDLEQPEALLGRTTEPLLLPSEPYERTGIINNVLFPTGALKLDDELWLYCGAADTCICLVVVSLASTMQAIG